MGKAQCSSLEHRAHRAEAEAGKSKETLSTELMAKVAAYKTENTELTLKIEQAAHRMIPTTTEALEGHTPAELEALATRLRAGLQLVEAARQAKILCVVCMESQKEVIFYPCRHKVACRGCAEKVGQCPMCRADVVDRIVPFD
eukprot:NODE_3185_length_485_cov_774.165138_g2542_i0.p1 GENE.NODE_3185_length_485_cov_774.165138_g2542_i0~~NODE_3185_length_485_cov_774.165138_g2542_i0.p1  ORF type:complete len:150 (-),score=76.09 NODE_3185_length_485_cov_774.165138_g2542_i0:34-462(-)